METLVSRYFDDKGREWGTYKITCDKCGGSGYQHNVGWLRADNGVGRCFKCNGVGFTTKDRRILTDREKAQRERAKVRKEEKKLEAENQRQKEFKKFLEENPITYICIDKKSYDERENLKAVGYRWIGQNWVGQEKTDLESIEVETKKVVESINEYGKLVYNIVAIKEAIENHKRKSSRSEYVGNVGEKVDTEVIVEKMIMFESRYGYIHLYIMKDTEENILVWKTSKLLNVEINDKIKIIGKIKSHNEYGGIKQTELTRCKIV